MLGWRSEAFESLGSRDMPRVPRLLGMVLGAILCLAPPAALAVLIDRFGVNLPHTDQWELVPLMQKQDHAGFSLTDFFAQHGEQRIVFPRLLMLALAPLTNWNIRVELFVNFLLAAAIFLILVRLLADTLSALGRWFMVPAACASLMIFSPVQWENLLWGWAISWFLPLLTFLIAVTALAKWPEDRPAWPAVLIAVAAAVLSQYSLFHGTLTWISCIPILIVRKNLRKFIGVWVLAGVAFTALYLYGRHPSHWEGFYASPHSLVRDPRMAFEYLSYYLGRPVLDLDPSFWVGTMLVVLFILSTILLLVVRRDRLESGVIWFSIGCYALLTAVMTMLGRLKLGLGNAGASRYTTIGILLMLSTAALISLLLASSRAGSSLRVVAVTGVWLVLGAAFLADYPSEVASMRQAYVQRLDSKQCLLRVTSADDPCLTLAYPDKHVAFRRSLYLKDMGWGGLTRAP
jgi:hypothetical protein